VFFDSNVIRNYSLGAVEISLQEASAVLVHLLQDAVDADMLALVVRHGFAASDLGRWCSDFLLLGGVRTNPFVCPIIEGPWLINCSQLLVAQIVVSHACEWHWHAVICPLIVETTSIFWLFHVFGPG
jgi:hypothetical protein